MAKYTENDIKAYDNVPIDVAADYLGVYADRVYICPVCEYKRRSGK